MIDGLGIWIAYKPERHIAKLTAMGAGWVAPRAGIDGWNDPGLQPSDLLAYRRAALPCYPWIYCRRNAWTKCVTAYKQLWDTGLCDGFIVNAEVEWTGADALRIGLDAASFVECLRKDLPDAFIAHAPMDYVGYHPSFPWEAFGKLDAVMPQVYAWEHDDRGHVYHLETTEKQWSLWEAKHPAETAQRWPIGCSYRPKYRGFKDGKPSPNSHMENEGARVAADVAAFLDHPLTQGKPVSLYSLEAMPIEVYEMLVARAVDATPTPRDAGLNLGDAGHAAIPRTEGEHSIEADDTSPEGVKIT